MRGAGEGPLFRFVEGEQLIRSRLVTEVREALKKGIRPEDYARHTFCIGAATTAAACGFPVDMIKTLGLWRSQAYQLYIKLPQHQLADISKKLTSSSI